MDEKYIKLSCQVGAHEYLIQRLYMLAYASAKMTPEQIRKSHENMRETVRIQKWPNLDVGHTALIGGELEDAIRDFLGGLESMLEGVGLLPKGQ